MIVAPLSEEAKVIVSPPLLALAPMKASRRVQSLSPQRSRSTVSAVLLTWKLAAWALPGAKSTAAPVATPASAARPPSRRFAAPRARTAACDRDGTCVMTLLVSLSTVVGRPAGTRLRPETNLFPVTVRIKAAMRRDARKAGKSEGPEICPGPS